MKNNKPSFTNLKIWKRSHKLSIIIYNITNQLPKNELYGITSQLRRASSSIPANIVEGYARRSKKEFAQFLYQARGSLSEVRYFLILARDLKYIPNNSYDKLEEEYQQLNFMLNSFITAVKDQKNDKS